MRIKHFFDPDTFTLTYVVTDEKTLDSLIIDPVLDFDPASGKVTDKNFQLVLSFVKEQELNVKGIIETHAHADHLSSSQLWKREFPNAVLAIGEKIKLVQEVFAPHFNLSGFKTDGSQFDFLFKDFEMMNFGSLSVKAIPSPGHTPACMSYQINDAIFTGDSLFMPDYGTGRCDFPKGSAVELYHSIHQNLYALPDTTRVFVGHDYFPEGRQLQYETTIGESKKHNIQLKAQTTEAEYVKFRQERDQTLNAPRLLLPSIQVNINAGHLPTAQENGKSYLKIPLNIKLT